jgi:hypothetical protein
MPKRLESRQHLILFVMKKLNFIESPKSEKDLKQFMFPQMFNLSNEDLEKIKGGQMQKPCDAVCLPKEWSGPCTCYNNVA